MTQYTKKVVENSIIIFVFVILSAFFGYLTRLLYSKNLTPTDFGLFYAVYALMGFFITIRDAGLETLARFIPEYIVKKEPVLIKSTITVVNFTQMALGGIISLSLMLLSAYLSEIYFHDTKAFFVLILLAIGFWFKGFLDLLRVTFQGFQRLTICSSVDLTINVLILVGSFIFFKLGLGIMGPTLAYLLYPLILLPFYYIIFVKKVFPDFNNVKSEFKKSLVKKILRYASYVALGLTGGMLLGYTDTLCLTYFSGLKQVALYNIAMPIAMLLTYVSVAISGIFFPVVVELWTKKNKGYIKLGVELAYKFLLILILPVALIVFSFPEVFINILFGNRFVAAGNALRILSLGMIFLVLNNVTRNTIAAIGKPKTNTKIVFFVVIMNFIMNIILIPYFGIEGAAFATSLSYAFMLVAGYIFLRRFIKIEVNALQLVKLLGISFLLIGVMYFLKNYLKLTVWLETAVIITTILLIYLILIFSTRVVTVYELKKLYHQIRVKG